MYDYKDLVIEVYEGIYFIIIDGVKLSSPDEEELYEKIYDYIYNQRIR